MDWLPVWAVTGTVAAKEMLTINAPSKVVFFKNAGFNL
jgi:hypothetical protein